MEPIFGGSERIEASSPWALVRLLQLEGVEITRESLVKIERGAQHIKASQLRGIRDALHTTYDELLAEAEKR